MICVPLIQKCLLQLFLTSRLVRLILGARNLDGKGFFVMPDALLNRLETALGKLLDQNRQLDRQYCLLKAEKMAWEKEKSELLGEVEQVLQRLDSLKLEDT